MKKFYLFGGMGVATALIAAATTYSADTDQSGAAPQAEVSSAATVPYYSAAAATSSQISDGWSVINANGDAKLFEPASEYSSPTRTAMKIGWSAADVPQDDYLISPAVHLSAGTEYKVGYTWKGSSYGENATIYMSTATTADEIKASDAIHDFDTDKTTAYTKYWDTFTPEADGDYHFVFYLHSLGNKGTVYFADVTIVENKFAPASVSGLKATPGADRELSCKLEWTLPTSDVFGEAIPDDKPITAVKIYRDGVEIENTGIEATATEFTDTEETGLTSGYHVYCVSVVAGDAEGTRTEVGPTNYVGPVVPFDLPANLAISSADAYSLWTTVNDQKEWAFDSSYGAKYMLSGTGNHDNWLITPPLNVTEEGYYRITVTAFSTTTDENSFEVCLLSSLDLETATKTVVSDNWQLGQAYANTSSVKPVVSFDFKLNDTGTYYVGFHSTTEKSSYATYYFMGANIEKTSFVPGAVKNLIAVPAANFENAIEVSWENPTTSLTGDEINSADYQIEIYLNNSDTPAETLAGDQTSATVNVNEPGIYNVTVKAVSIDSDHGTAPNPPTVSTAWVGSHEVAVPYTTEFTQDDPTVAIWEIVDGNEDGITFSHYATTYSHYMEFSAYSKVYKDYLLSPHMMLSPGFYQVTISQNGSSSTPASPVLGVIKAGTFEVDNIEMISSLEINLNSYSLTSDLIFEVKEEGLYQVVYGLDQTFASNYTSMKFNKLTVQAADVFPGDVTELVATVTGDDNDAVELSWVNPSTMYNSEIPMSAIDCVVILRDGEEIATITEDLTPGEAASYTDTEATDGTHTYIVKVLDAEGNGHEDTFPSVTTDWVGAGQAAPVDLLTKDGRFPAWTFIDVDGNHDKEDMYTWRYFSQKYMIEGANYTNDDYLVSSPLKINENEIYEVSYFMSAPMGGNNDAMNVDVKIGSYKDDITDFTTVHTINLPAERSFKAHSFYLAVGNPDESEEQPEVSRVKALAEENEPDAAELYKSAAKIPAGGDFKVALHAIEKGGIDLTEFHFAKVADFDPDSTTSIDLVEVAGVSFDGNALHFNGHADVAIYDLTGKLVATASDAEGSYAVRGIAAGCYIVNVATTTETHTLKVVIK